MLWIPGTQQHSGTLPSRLAQVMTILSAGIGATFQVVLPMGRPLTDPTLIRQRNISPSEAVQISLIVYGPYHEALEVGDWLSRCDLFLQEPKCCDRNVPYCNPQSLSFDDEQHTMTFEIENMRTREEATEYCQPLNLLAELDENDLEEAEQPRDIATRLHRYGSRRFFGHMNTSNL